MAPAIRNNLLLPVVHLRRRFMGLSKYAVLAAACAGCTVYEAPATLPSVGMPESSTPTATPDSAQPRVPDASSTSQDVFDPPVDVATASGTPTADSATAEDAPPTPALD